MRLNLKRLKAERIAREITQDEMAQKMGWGTRSSYAKRENGLVNIGVDEFIEMAEILGYKINDIGIFFMKNVPKKERKKKVGSL